METHQMKYLKDYRPPAFLVTHIDLTFDLHDADTFVTSVLTMKRNPDGAEAGTPLVLDGKEMTLTAIRLDGAPLDPDAYTLSEESLTIPRVPDRFTLETEVTIRPGENDALSGLYRSGGMFCTQCEAEGFRKITFFPDRPDVMAAYTCTIIADKTRFPVLLSNGNRIDAADLPGGRHRVKWEDPFKKPSYLFALVAGDLFCLEDRFTTRSGRDVTLQIYVEHINKDKCAYAMAALKKAMAWDEERFGREYDLDIYMIVAVSDFNMGAMENKGLNVFNAKYVLAKPETATDMDFWNIERVIAHEYFHNWTGNRITLRNWFQLSLKEGLTVFRDQEFTADTTSRPVKRISDVRTLRSYQFPEDAGPMAHPVRPASYIKMDNFYTVTVYEKGAEVIRMIHTLLGPERFRKGMDLYFERHDGQAVTLEEFVGAMADAGELNLDQFMRWYSQAGTPVITVERDHDPEARTFTLTFSQFCPPTPDMSDKAPMHIPMAVGLLDGTGNDIPLRLTGEAVAGPTTRVLDLRKAVETFTFQDVPEAPVPSLLRGFSAPVKLKTDLADRDRIFLFANDSDPFNRWEAGQSLFSNLMLRLIQAKMKGEALALPAEVSGAFRETLLARDLDKSFVAQALTLPGESDLAILMSETAPIDPSVIHAVRRFVVRALAEALASDFETVIRENQDTGDYTTDPASVGRRTLKNLALAYLGRIETPDIIRRLSRQFTEATNMTDQIAALSCLADIDCPERIDALDGFYKQWGDDTLVRDKWFSIQAGSSLPGTLETVKKLTGHTGFSIKNPNKVRALIGAFCSSNPNAFHDPSGAGYRFLADRVLEINDFNAQIAAYLARAFNHWKKYEPGRRELMKIELDRISKAPDLTQNVYEIVTKALTS